ncbi:MAG: nucleoside triphosphate pyrophosphohydrolase family protein [bacterium]|nr:nucleoside triphosphate pyrophosphohydrolase family protein [bacterium]
MTFEEYQAQAGETAIYPNKGENPVYPTLGLTGEAGEVAEKMKKIIRDKGGVLDETSKQEIAKELGDVLWYVAALSSELKIPMDTIAQMNIEKLRSRKDRGQIHGGGDNR